MFNLEQSITGWRQRMLDAGVKSPVPLEELELHLREEIERQAKMGLEGQAAFNLAAQNIGPGGALRKEFGKVGEAMSAWQRKFNVALCAVCAIPIGLTGVMILFTSFGNSPVLSFQEQMLVSGSFISVALIWSGWWFSCGFFPALSKRMRIKTAVLCIVLSGFCAAPLLGFILWSASTTGEAMAAGALMMLPLALATGIIFALEETAYRKAAVPEL